MKTKLFFSLLFLNCCLSAWSFSFVNKDIDRYTLYFSTESEQDPYPFYVEQWIKEEWQVVAEVFGRGGADTNRYEVPLPSLFYGINKVRIKKETGWDYYAFSPAVSVFIKQDKVMFFVKNRSIIFSDTAYYKILSDHGHIFSRGYNHSCTLDQLEKGKYLLQFNNRKKRLIVRRKKVILRDQL